MTRVLKLFRWLFAIVLGVIALWCVFSLKWSRDEMSMLEVIAGVVYLFLVVPVWYWMNPTPTLPEGEGV